jgi:hypothetical protein
MSMNFIRATAGVATFVLLAEVAQPQSAPSPKSAAQLEEVLVSGEIPGPQLWKLTAANGHLLWILATVTPKPRNITWKSKEVGNVLDFTQEVIDQQLQGTKWAANITLDVASFNPLAGLSASRRAAKLRKEAPPPPLREVLPPDVYERFAKLKSRYLPKDVTIEKQRPRIAANRLFNAAVEAHGLSSRAMIHEEVHKLASRRRVKVSDVSQEFEFDIDTMVTVYTEFNQIPPADELPCMLETIEQLESHMGTITERANAWATGNVPKLRTLPHLRRESCDSVYWSAPRWSQLDSQLDTLWLNTVEKAVAKNKSTLVMLDMAELLQTDGLLAALASRGYQVEGP